MRITTARAGVSFLGADLVAIGRIRLVTDDQHRHAFLHAVLLLLGRRGHARGDHLAGVQPDPLAGLQSPNAAAISTLALYKSVAAKVRHGVSDGVPTSVMFLGKILLRGQQTPWWELSGDDLLPYRVRDLPVQRQAGAPGDHAGDHTKVNRPGTFWP